MKALFLAVLVAVLGFLYGPGLPIDEKTLKDTYGNKAVLVCGASYGIGAEIAYGFAKANAKIVISARSKDKLENVAAKCRELGAAQVVVIPADFSKREDCKNLVEKTVSAVGALDVLVLNHIIGFYEDWAARLMKSHASGTIEDDLDFVDMMFKVNTLSYISLSSYALPALAENAGRIIAVGSAAGKQGLPRVAPYSSTKHSVFGYFDSLRQDLVASKDVGLQAISVTTGILGSFDTETAREGTKGLLDDGLVTWHPPSKAADALLHAGALRWREVYVPWEQTRLATLLHPLFPTFMDWVIRVVTLSSEGKP